MPKLDISSSQATEIVTPADPLVQLAFSAGVAIGIVPLLDSLPHFAELTPTVQSQVRVVFDLWIAAFVKAANIQHPFATPVPGVVVVPLAPLSDLGAAGSLTFTDGILTSYSAPT